MEENVASRLKLFIDTSGLTSSRFADMCGIPRPSLSQFLSGRNKKVSNELVGQIHHAFPDLSIMWLLFGEGPVRRSSEQNDAEKSPENPSTLLNFPTNDTAPGQYDKENGLNVGRNVSKQTDNKVFESDLKILDLQKQIEHLRNNPRKVVQITIYYDDSTFETFVPGSR